MLRDISVWTVALAPWKHSIGASKIYSRKGSTQVWGVQRHQGIIISDTSTSTFLSQWMTPGPLLPVSRLQRKSISDYSPSSYICTPNDMLWLWHRLTVDWRRLQLQHVTLLECILEGLWKCALDWQRKGWAVPYINLVFSKGKTKNKTKQKNRYTCKANASLRAAESVWKAFVIYLF